MKKTLSIISALLVLSSLSAQVAFRTVNTAEELDKIWKEASIENKAVFIDIYASWCGPCKWLDANVFSLPAAGKYMNKVFIPVKMDGETTFGRKFAQKNGLNAYPSLFIFNSEKVLMNKLTGAMHWEELSRSLQSTIEYYPVLAMLQSKFEADILKKEEYPAFLNALRKMGKDQKGYEVAILYAKNYMKSNKPATELDLKVLAFFTPQDQSNWDIVIDDIPLLKSALGVDLEEFIELKLSDAVELAMDERSVRPIKEYCKYLPELCQETRLDPVETETHAYVSYYHYSDMFKELIGYIDSNYEQNYMGDDTWLFNAASTAVFLDPQNTEVAEKGLEWFQTCIDLEEKYEYYYNLALCQYFTSQPDKTLQSLGKAMEVTNDTVVKMKTQELIDQLKAQE